MSWQAQEVQQRLSELLRTVESVGPQIITRHRVEIAVIVSMSEYRRLIEPKESFVEH
jgi:prevent-host-death family protein